MDVTNSKADYGKYFVRPLSSLQEFRLRGGTHTNWYGAHELPPFKA